MADETNSSKFSTVFLVAVLIAVSFLAGSFYNRGRGSNETSGSETSPSQNGAAPTVAEKSLSTTQTVGSFTVLDQSICTEAGKPVVYYFGSSGCPHCKWEYPIITEVVKKFGTEIDFRDRMDSQEDMAVFSEYQDYNHGAVPFLLFGCRYLRVGSGERDGETQEAENLTALICKLTEGQPTSVCSPVTELTATIE